jgi:2-desacetyl-2-hydroxyethyl bacteriochlorophyllide A dehydrogenase
MKRQTLYFTAPAQVCVVSENLPDALDGQLLVRSVLSAISPGTEMLIYHGLWPKELRVDESIPALGGEFGFPLKYGYAMVGQVVECGPGAGREWLGRRVFSFHPHESLFWAAPEELIVLPESVAFEDAAFLPNMETAVNFVMDGAPLAGEQVAVFGQGVVGLLTTSLLAQFPLAALVSVERYPLRRSLSLQIGAHTSLDPGAAGGLEAVKASLQSGRAYPGADLTYELSGAPEVLNAAIECTGFNGRVIVGSWYGQKSAPLELGGRFHRSRIRLISSQVSSLAPELSGRWSKSRRFEWVWEMVRRVHPARLITQRLPFDLADQAYTLLDQSPDQAVQVVLNYGD